jgi:phosphatidate phosphatase LPIN
LSSRAIGQANFTRDHLRSIVQENVTLPDGPLLLSPKSLFLAFHQYVPVSWRLKQKPAEKSKIFSNFSSLEVKFVFCFQGSDRQTSGRIQNCLSEDIRALFPPDRNPFFAAYGNKTTDLIAYTAVGVPKNRIFTINYQGQLKHEVLRHAQSSYSHQSTLVDMMFPPLRVLSSRNELVSELEGADEFGAFSFWKQPLPDIEKTFLLPSPEEEPVSSKSGKTKAKVATNGKISASPTKDDAKRSRK